MEHRAWQPGTSRRQLLKMTAAGVVAMGATPAKMLAQTAAPEFPKPDTPEQAIQLLLQGNEHYLKGQLTECSANFAMLRHDSEEEQKPFAAILCCADSRVPVEILFDRSIGHLFVVRVAGNISTPDTIASLEYAVAVLGVKAVLVVGHTRCGAVTAAKHGGTEPGTIAGLFQYIYPATLGMADVPAGDCEECEGAGGDSARFLGARSRADKRWPAGGGVCHVRRGHRQGDDAGAAEALNARQPRGSSGMRTYR